MSCILAENLGEVIDFSTKTHLDSVAVILAKATQIANRLCPTPLSQMVFEPLAFSWGP